MHDGKKVQSVRLKNLDFAFGRRLDQGRDGNLERASHSSKLTQLVDRPPSPKPNQGSRNVIDSPAVAENLTSGGINVSPRFVTQQDIPVAEGADLVSLKDSFF